MHPTRTLLLDTAAQLLETRHPDDVSGQMVLRASGVSHGSLYHHFEDASEVVETVLIENFFSRALGDMEMLGTILGSAADKKDWIARAIAMTKDVHSPANKAFRIQRAQLLAYATSRPRMLARLSLQQNELTAGFARIFASAQEKGWFNPGIDPHAGALLSQAVILGRIVDDVASVQIDPEKWDHMIATIMEKVLAA